MQDCNFSKWIRIKREDELKGAMLKAGNNCPGLYAIAYSDKDLHNKNFDFIEEIIYFGMSLSIKGLKGRMYQFFSSISGKGNQHSGAKRMRQDLGLKDKEWKNKIYVSLMPCLYVDVTSLLRRDMVYMGDIAKEEYVCFANYCEKFGRLPRFNEDEFSRKKH